MVREQYISGQVKSIIYSYSLWSVMFNTTYSFYSREEYCKSRVSRHVCIGSRYCKVFRRMCLVQYAWKNKILVRLKPARYMVIGNVYR